jgi:hypothetical protein
MENNNKNNLGLFAAVFAAIFGTTYGAYKLFSGSMENSEVRRVKEFVDKLFLEGKDEVTITNMLIVDASRQLGDKFSQDVIDRIKATVLEEKMKLRKEGKIKEET